VRVKGEGVGVPSQNQAVGFSFAKRHAVGILFQWGKTH
jgi:hypothetical protein